MLPKSYNKVSQETKMTVQLYIARATGFFQGTGRSDDRVRTVMEEIENQAMKDALEIALEAHEKRHKPCTAELFVQRFANLLWENCIGDNVQAWPYEFTTSVDSGPLAPDFLDAIGKTQIEHVSPYLMEGNNSVKEDQSFKKEEDVKMEDSPEEIARLPLYSEPASEEPAILKSGTLDSMAAEGKVKATGRKRKNDER